MTAVYIAPIPDQPVGSVYPPQRQAQLDETANEAYRRQRYFVWKLLEYGLRHSFGLSLRQLGLTLDQRGRWSCPECFFSLSHCSHGVAVALSDVPVGVDLESMSRTVHPGLAGKLLTPGEQQEFACLEEAERSPYLLEKWCIRESLFKWREASATPQPKEAPCTGRVTVAGHALCYALAADQPHQLYLLEDAIWN